MTQGPKIALIHDYLTQYGGAEQVLATLQQMFPDAITFTSLHDPAAHLPGLDRVRIVESKLGSARWFRQHHRAALPLFPLAMWDLSRRLANFDVIIADSSAWAHQVSPQSGQALVVYCHSPARFLYGDSDYLGATGVAGGRARVFHGALAPFRWLDRRAFQRAHVVLANSNQVSTRLEDAIGIEADVLYPPINVAEYMAPTPAAPEDWYLVVSRLVPHKRVDLAVETATRYEIPLRVIGGGRDLTRLRGMAGPTVEFLGFVPRPVVIDHLQRCKALILPGVEDFGMTSVEAQAAGRPVIAINRGGARESVVDGKSGVLFDEQTPEALKAAMEHLDRLQVSAEACMAHARKFDEPVFRAGILRAIDEARQKAHP